MFVKIPGNAQEDSGECSKIFQEMLNKIPGNVQKASGECSRRSQGMLKKIMRNVQEDYGECSRRFQGMLTKILENAQKDWTLYSAIKPKGNILKNNQKHALKLIKISHMKNMRKS